MSPNGFIVVGGHPSPSVAGARMGMEIRCVGEGNLTGGGTTHSSTVAAEIPGMTQGHRKPAAETIASCRF
jgi:hypothetical protein